MSVQDIAHCQWSIDEDSRDRNDSNIQSSRGLEFSMPLTKIVSNCVLIHGAAVLAVTGSRLCFEATRFWAMFDVIAIIALR